tara:strand:- start:406 stop:759 length:354 start_codon:yes stop_codon:yes gene_type:complete
MNTQKIIYGIDTGLLSLMIIGSAFLYFVQTEEIAKVFKLLGYPTHLIIPIAVAKILGILMLLRNREQKLVEWAYAGLFFEFLLATFSHWQAQDGDIAASIAALVLLRVSYNLKNKVR